jgi:hypothetical protein
VGGEADFKEASEPAKPLSEPANMRTANGQNTDDGFTEAPKDGLPDGVSSSQFSQLAITEPTEPSYSQFAVRRSQEPSADNHSSNTTPVEQSTEHPLPRTPADRSDNWLLIQASLPNPVIPDGFDEGWYLGYLKAQAKRIREERERTGYYEQKVDGDAFFKELRSRLMNDGDLSPSCRQYSPLNDNSNAC